jgi:metallophosphoesterase (TIGR00282 family)
MNILFVGDVVGKVGRKSLSQNLAKTIEKYSVDFTIVNGENISNGRGMNKNHYEFLLDLRVNCITLGNHYDDRQEIESYLGDAEEVVRPLNIKRTFPGFGTRLFYVGGRKVRVSNLLGKAFMKEDVDDPFESLEKVIENDESDIHIVDFHAESTGEKKALAYALKGSITAFVGTHTHVQTNDAQILNTGVAFISDVGMCGSYNSVLGDEIDSVVKRVIFHDEKSHFKLLEDDDTIFDAALLNIDDITLKARKITSINIITKNNE